MTFPIALAAGSSGIKLRTDKKSHAGTLEAAVGAQRRRPHCDDIRHRAAWVGKD